MDTPPLKHCENSLYTVRRNDYFNERHYGTRYYKNNALGFFWILVLHSYIFSAICFSFTMWHLVANIYMTPNTVHLAGIQGI